MQARLLALVVALVALPSIVLTALVVKMVEDDEAMAKVELTRLIDERLQSLQTVFSTELDRVQDSLLAELPERSLSAEALRTLRRESGLVSQLFVLGPDGRLVHPPKDSSRSAEERAFVARTEEIWSGDAVLYEPPRPEPSGVSGSSGSSSLSRRDVQVQKRSAPPSKKPTNGLVGQTARRDHGWQAWYWKDGLRFLFWRKLADGGVIGAEVERVVVLSRILGRLPTLSIGEDRLVLVDSRGDQVQQWGAPEANGAPLVTRRLAYPLDGFRLQYVLSPTRGAALIGGETAWALGLSGVAVVGLLALLGAYVYREASQRMRDAAQRVTFVTQVSHELKTPLSNIRLYAELLEDELDDDEHEAEHDRVQVIVSESQRLARLIDNVLVYAKVRRGTHRIEPRAMVADDGVRRVLAQFAPALETKGITVETGLSAPKACFADPDAVEQVLANLVGNVEKYAAGGAWLRIETAQDDTGTWIVVGDRGPGIPAAARARVFEPFERLSDRLADGVTGTGIGLAIARSLASQMGGDLSVIDRSPGAWFELRLPPVGDEGGRKT